MVGRNIDKKERCQKLGQCHLLIGICRLLLILLLSACRPKPKLPLRIGTRFRPGYEPLYLTRSLGFRQGSSINLIGMTSASEFIHDLRNGMLEEKLLRNLPAVTGLTDGSFLPAGR